MSPLPDCPFIFLDGTWINLKRAYTEGRANVQGECAMVALGYTNDGKKRVLSFSVTPNEGASAWEKVLGDLKERRCRNPLMFITDGLQDMTEAIARVFPKARHQRCIVHVSRNLLNMCRKRVSMNSIGNCLYSILAAVRWYNASASRRTLRCLEDMTDGELKQCGFTARAS